jgi:hypothetical protein
LFAKILSGLPWFTIIQLLPVENVKEMLTDEVIAAMWPKPVQNQYECVRKDYRKLYQTQDKILLAPDS